MRGLYVFEGEMNVQAAALDQLAVTWPDGRERLRECEATLRKRARRGRAA